MDNYTKAYTSLLTMLSGALRIEFIGNETIMEDLTLIKLGLDELQDYKKALDKACDYLEDGFGDEMASEYYFVDGKKHYLDKSEEWKKFLLESEQDGN